MPRGGRDPAALIFARAALGRTPGARKGVMGERFIERRARKCLAESRAFWNLNPSREWRQYITVSRARNYFFRPRAGGGLGLRPTPNLFIVARRAR
jgi:hypothetical protein